MLLEEDGKNKVDFSMKDKILHGTIYLLIAQAVFVASGYAIHIGLGRLLGPSNYGIYAVVISLMTMVNLILATGIPQALSKYVAHGDISVKAVRDISLKIQLVFSLGIFLIYYIIAGKIALLLNDEGLTPLIRLSSFIVPSYALYSISTGYLNGLQEYKKQAITAISYSFFKAIFILVMVLIGYALRGAIFGFVLAPMAALLIGIYCTKQRKFVEKNSQEINKEISVRQVLDFAIPIIFFSVITNLISNIDLFFVKAYLTDYDAGIYSASSTISKVPFYLTTGLYGALFPLISKNAASNNIKKNRKYAVKSFKYLFIAMAPTVFVIYMLSEELLTLLYSIEYIGGAQVLSILIIGIGFFSLFSLLTTILNGIGMPRISVAISILLLFINILLNITLIPKYHIIGAAIATSTTSLIGLILSSLCVYRYL
ncbi:flippase [Methanolobus sp. WCC4]|uniref:flippase n=1 Tax=Methanolobus sp. WCC4 TaxID=3125784 RepID=UPI0030FA174F